MHSHQPKLTVEVLSARVDQLLLDIVDQCRLGRLRIPGRIAIQIQGHILGTDDVGRRLAGDVTGRDPQRVLALEVIDQHATHGHAHLLSRIDVARLIIPIVAARDAQASSGDHRIGVAGREVVNCRRVVAEATGVGHRADAPSDADYDWNIYPDTRRRQAEQVVVVGGDLKGGDPVAGIVVVDRLGRLHLRAHAVAEEHQR